MTENTREKAHRKAATKEAAPEQTSTEDTHTENEEPKKLISTVSEETFHSMTGMSLQEKTYLNMIAFYKPELMKVINSEDEAEALRKLSPSVKRSLKNNGIIIKGWGKYEITPEARKHLK